jgi:hypothetical protein
MPSQRRMSTMTPVANAHTAYPLVMIGISFRLARAASQVVRANSKVGIRLSASPWVNMDTATCLSPVDEWTIHNASGMVSGMVAAMAANSLLYFSRTAIRMMTSNDRTTGKISCNCKDIW